MPRARQVLDSRFLRGLSFYPTGSLNAITDVPGVEVGQVTLRDAARGLATGVTAIWPSRDIWERRLFAGGHVLHGAGECTGYQQIAEWGILETPIVLASSLAVGRAVDGIVTELVERHPAIADTDDVVLPVVMECDDSFLSDARSLPVTASHVRQALQAARTGAVQEGAVGAGTGMMAFDFKAGIGTASRRVKVGAREFTLGVLLNANVGVRKQLRVGGYPVGAQLTEDLMPEPHPERSIVAVLATDAPLRPDQLRRLCARISMGFVRAGSYASHGSGEIVVGFSTTAGEPRASRAKPTVLSGEWVADAALSPLYEACAEMSEEAILNALVAASGEGPVFAGRGDHRVYSLPIERVNGFGV